MNRRELLSRALESLQRQTRPCDRALVIDAGNDESDVLCRQYAFVTYVRQTTRGLTPARNEALALATEDYVGMLDSDDYYEPRFLEVCADLLEQGADVAYTQGYRITPLARQPILVNHKQPTDVLRSLVEDNFVIASFALQRRSCFTRVGGYREGLALADDYDLYLRFAMAGFQFRHAAAPLSNRLHHEGSLTLSNPVANTEAIRGILLHHQQALCRALGCSQRQLMSGSELRMGQSYLVSGQRQKAGPHFFRALWGAPWQWRAWAFLLAWLTSPYSLPLLTALRKLKRRMHVFLSQWGFGENRW